MKNWPIRSAVAYLGVMTATVLPGEYLTFEQHVRPIFRKHCFDCHGASDEIKGNLDLRLVRFILQGGESGEAIVAGEPEDSYLVDRIRSGEMPPGPNDVEPDEVATIVKWIKQGAKTVRPEPEQIEHGLGVTFEERSFWSFQPIQRPAIPTLNPSARPRIRTPIDAFVLDAMPDSSEKGFSSDADRRTLIRRAHLDLTGLPPTFDETQFWLSYSAGDWFERMIDKVLESPQYGERWARHWLDIAGYADSEGFTVSDAVRPWAWKYRDWVVRSLNRDKTFDQLVVEQLAGDELAGPIQGDLTPDQIELLTATGFLRMAADGTGSGANTPQARNQVIVDTLKIVGTSLLGLSLQCAQCHDHRYDPILQTDYFSLRAILEPALDWQAWKTPQDRRISLYTSSDRQRAAEIDKQAQVVEKERNERQQKFIDEELEKQINRVSDEAAREPLRAAFRTPDNQRNAEQKALLAKYPFVRQLSAGSLYLYNSKAADELKKMQAQISRIRAAKRQEEFLRPLMEPPNHLPETKLFHRGDFQQPKQTVEPAGLTVTSQAGERIQFSSNDSGLASTGRRLAFAKWLTSGRHPLVARVIVNRIWLHHFGRGIVETPSDLGKLGGRPSHPKLLDWLASEFMRQGWSLKRLHRLILSSTVWRQSSRHSETNQWDPRNRFYSRKSIQRLDAEAIRDRVLFVTGELSNHFFGPPIGLTQDDSGQIRIDQKSRRRSLYSQVRRSQPVALLKAFDAPVMETNCERRTQSTAATQSLMMMNGEFILSQSAKLASKILESKPTLEKQLSLVWQTVLNRQPTQDEVSLSVEFLQTHIRFFSENESRLPKGSTAEHQALANLCQSLLSCNEFLYVD